MNEAEFCVLTDVGQWAGAVSYLADLDPDAVIEHDLKTQKLTPDSPARDNCVSTKFNEFAAAYSDNSPCGEGEEENFIDSGDLEDFCKWSIGRGE